MGKRGPRQAINSNLRYRSGYPPPGPMETWLMTHDLGTDQEIAASSPTQTILFARDQDRALAEARADVLRAIRVALALLSAVVSEDHPAVVASADIIRDLQRKYTDSAATAAFTGGTLETNPPSGDEPTPAPEPGTEEEKE